MKNVLYKNSICHFIKEKINLSLIQMIFFNYAKWIIIIIISLWIIILIKNVINKK